MTSSSSRISSTRSATYAALSLPQLSDDHVRLAVGGDRDAIEHVIDYTVRTLPSMVYKLCPERLGREELAHEISIQVYKYLPQLRNATVDGFRGWLWAVVSSAKNKRMRRASQEAKVLAYCEDIDSFASRGREVSNLEEQIDHRRATAWLDSDSRSKQHAFEKQVLKLAGEGLKPTAISRELGASLSTIKRTLRRAEPRLKALAKVSPPKRNAVPDVSKQPKTFGAVTQSKR